MALADRTVGVESLISPTQGPTDPQLGGKPSMSVGSDPTDAIRTKAAAFPTVAPGTSCNQSAFKVGKRAFLYIGPGAKGRGFKAMFKLDQSMARARELAAAHPDRFEVGSTGWVTTRFTEEEPLAEALWEPWLEESYELADKGRAKK